MKLSVSLSDDDATATQLGLGVVTVVPVTSNTEKVYPFQVLISRGPSGLDVDSKAQAEQVRSVAVQRLTRLIGRVSPAELRVLDDELRLHLSL
ncbi:MAG: type II toxin-antitoxin system PemK/MazF family toxin [Mycobacterium sp.]|mgnify:CR=1 FL=1|nr:type II toxin-antitoxin system PemK/MazF family toxin [Mycobacterium sp.]